MIWLKTQRNRTVCPYHSNTLLEQYIEELIAEHNTNYTQLEKEKKAVADELDGVNHFLKQKEILESELEKLKEDLELEKKNR